MSLTDGMKVQRTCSLSDYVGPEHDANGMGLGVQIVWSLAGTELTFFIGSLYGAVLCICG